LGKLLSIDPGVLRTIRNLPKRERIECLLALCELVEGFGQPHRHAGTGIRKLGGKLYECRGTIALRFLFQDRPGELYVCFLGTHDEVRALLRRGTYR
jgi:hypothetical protein